MKNKKILIISIIIVLILVVVGAVVGFLYYQNMKKNQEEHNEAVKKYERIEGIANKINTTIDEKIKSTNEFIATNPDVRRR